MRDEAENRSNVNNNPEKKKKKTDGQFEFCRVCRLNHDQGRRHKYFPNHAKSLSSLLSRFQEKLSDVRFFLKNPSPLRPEHASRNRLWCVFCDSDVVEAGSSFACGNAINHLASAEHLKKLKSFMWKHGGGMEKLDSFRLSETDLAKWDKKCTSLLSEAASEGSRAPLIGPSNDIHNELNSECIDSFQENTNHFLGSKFSNSVMPLQSYTNERCQVSHSEISDVKKVGPLPHDANAYLPAGTQYDTHSWAPKYLTGYMDSQQPMVFNGGNFAANFYPSSEWMYQAHPDERMVNGESSSQGLHNLTQISAAVQEGAKGNVHSGAPPPWFDATEENLRNSKLTDGLGKNNLASSLKKSGKSQKLNPKRVGAAWAEKRKIELEMEKRGEIATDNFDVNWLPNFGRVWQSGSRKESRKEFQVENKNSPKGETQSETLIEIQPYVSKRKRTEVEQ
ncbi:TITAN-like protein isoform X1 [Rhododendron vialii]|uniref:TITAN-like protein isoform X1 n=1 Tax=Rhododendron vialii TaxID=182163 RepID=UPI00265FC007|nr:TITAN-like protein isoform X1 [Rhododendron vialii]